MSVHRTTRRRQPAPRPFRKVALIAGVLLLAIITIVFAVNRKAAPPQAAAKTVKAKTPAAKPDDQTAAEDSARLPAAIPEAPTEAPPAAESEPATPAATTLSAPKTKRPEPWADLPQRFESPPLNSVGIATALAEPAKATWENVSLPEFVRELRSAYQMNAILDEKAFEAAGIDPLTKRVTWKDAKGSLELALSRMLEPKKLAWTVNRDTLWITTKDGLDFDWFAELDAYRTGPTITANSAGTLLRTVQEVEPKSWSTGGGPASMHWSGGVLFVRQHFGAQREIQKRFKNLRRLQPAAPANADDAKIIEELSAPISLTQALAPLDKIFSDLEEAREVPIALQTPEDYPGKNLELDGQPLGTVLEILLRPYGLTFVVRDDGVLVMPEAETRKSLMIKQYDLTDMSPTFNSIEALIECIEKVIEPTSWSGKGGDCRASASADGQQLVVEQTYRGHRELDRFFGLLTTAKKLRR